MRRIFSRSISSAASWGRKKKKNIIRRRCPLNRFRAIVRKIMCDIFWISDTTDWELGTNAELNVYILTHRKKRLLSLEDKICLRKPTPERTANEINTIMKKLRLFKAFKIYPEDVRREILFHAGFECWNKDRVLVRQGHTPGYAYFIVSGTALFEYTHPDPIFANETKHHIDKLGEGDGFGEMAILYNEPHSGTVTVSSDWIEVILLQKDRFISLLQETVKKHWDAIRWAFMKFPYFENFPEPALRHLCSHASLVTYPPGEIIPVKDEFGSNMVTMVVDGMCNVLQTIFIAEDKSKPMYKRFSLYKERIPENWGQLPDNVRPIIMQICTLRRKCIFGLGEQMSKNMILSESEVLALIIPRNLLLRYNITNIWGRIIDTLNLTYPKTDEIFHSFIENRRWSIYKTKLRKDINKCTKTMSMCIHDAPLSTRARMLRLRGQLYDKVVSMPYYKFGEIDIDNTMEIITLKKKSTDRAPLSGHETDKQRFEEEYLRLKHLYRETQHKLKVFKGVREVG
ncbi:uncharacterized protein LOC106665772 [Cimex lectularius]|uniref:Cyclic nucleotide-binding domain-containing protein n=1 Tax=Cimex lectularius TaxID=79782 RepID=A0A8I6RQA9_CIMLE|nr:uncharacterized protein LOC106665772 [Cimex lectularius]